MQRVILHIGAHKTATTHLQAQLQANSDKFPAGCVYVPLQEMRKAITPLATRSSSSQAELRSAMTSLEPFDHLILSDENIAGGPNQIKTGDLYCHVARNCKRLQSALPADAQLRVVFSVRDYRFFFSSMYCEYLRHNPFCTFKEYMANSGYREFSWAQVFSELQTVFDKDDLYLFQYELYKRQLKKMMDTMLPEGFAFSERSIPKSQQTSRSSFSASSIDLLQAATNFLDKEGVRKLANRLGNEIYAEHWAKKYKFTPLADDSSLKQQYSNDLRLLEKTGRLVPP